MISTDPQEQFEELKQSLIEKTKNILTVEGKTFDTVVDRVWIDDKLQLDDLKGQKEAKDKDKSWTVPVYAALKVRDKYGSNIATTKKIKIFDLPKMTRRQGFIVDGSEYQIANQFRLKSGVYTRKRRTGDITSQVNLGKGYNFSVNLDPKKGIYKIQFPDGANVKLYSMLKIFGTAEGEIKQTLGSLYEKNVELDASAEIKKVYRTIFNETAENEEEAITRLKEYFDDTQMRPEVNQITLGSPHSKVTKNLLLDIASKLYRVNRGEEKPDNRESLRFKDLMTVDDTIKSRLDFHTRRIQSSIKRRLGTSKEIKDVRMIIEPHKINKVLKSLFNTSDLSMNPTQINPIHMINSFNKTTISGEGGVRSPYAVVLEQRDIDPSHFGYLDPIHTPESGDVGTVLHLTTGVDKVKGNLVKQVYDLKTRKFAKIDPIKAYDSKVAFPGQYDDKYNTKQKLVEVMYQDEMVKVPAKEVDYVTPSSTVLFGVGTNMIPFLNSAQGARALMGVKQMEQALPMAVREAPLVQVQARKDSPRTMESIVGETSATTAPSAGVVTRIGKDYIVIKDNVGKDHRAPLYNNFSLNSTSYFHSEPTVKLGAKVRKGQIIADSNYTKDGALAVGKNMKVGYMSYKGYNLEDGIVMSESAAKKMTSTHMEKFEESTTTATITDKKKYAAYYPQTLTTAQLELLGDDGVVKVGTILKPGDPIMAILKKQEVTEEDILLGRLSKALKKPYRSVLHTYEKEDPGEVIEVIRTGNKISVRIKVEKPTKSGDKFAGRHGNKGVISLILSDADMPKTEDGEPLDMIFNPHGIPSRLNPSQLLETAAGKIAEKTGKPYVIRNFTGDDHLKNIQAELKANGLLDTEKVIDPATGKTLGDIMVGRQYIMKLDQAVEKKFSARSTGSYTMDLTPGHGGGEGGQAVDPLTSFSLLAHGAKHNLRDISTIKAQKNDEYWRALQLKEPLPAPRPSFAFERQLAMLKLLGANVEKKGSRLQLTPLQEAEVKLISSGEINSGKLFLSKNMKPEKGGLFDPMKTGGLHGEKWSHITLAEELPHPVFESAIKSLAGVTDKVYRKIIRGEMHVSKDGVVNEEQKGSTGGAGIKKLISGIDLKAEYKTSIAQAKGSKGTKLNKLNQKIRFLKNLIDHNLDTQVYFTKTLPVLPPKFRPIYPREDGTLITNPLNYLYKDTIDINEELKSLKDLPESEKHELRGDLYDAVRALTGIGSPLTNPEYRGVLDIIQSRRQPKHGFFQSKLLSKRQDMTGRSTITLDTNLHIDETGIPEAMLYKVFEPFVLQKLKDMGVAPLEGKELIKDRDPRASKALDIVIEDRTVLLNRAPSLHKHSIMAFKPVRASGKSIKLHPLVLKGFNADFDGDSSADYVYTYVDLKNNTDLKLDSVSLNRYDSVAEKVTETISLKEALMKYDGEVYLKQNGIHRVHISEIPYLPETKCITESGNEEYDVPDGVYMFSHANGDEQVTLRPVTKWSIHKDLDTVEVKTRKKRTSTVSVDHSLYCIDTDTLECKKVKPAFAESMKTPCPAFVDIPDTEKITEIDMSTYEKSKWTTHDTLPADEYLGYFLGSMCGDGWSSRKDGLKNPNNYRARNTLTLAGVDEGIKSKYVDCLIKFGHCGAVTQVDNPHTFKGFECFSQKVAIRNGQLSQLCCETLGHGAENKHLPPFFLAAPEDFRWGLLSGLLATDGSINRIKAKSKKKATFSIQYRTKSDQLSDDVRLLCTSLRIRSSKTSYSRNGDYWVISLFSTDVQTYALSQQGVHKINTYHEKKQAVLQELKLHKWSDTATLERHDIVPIPTELRRAMRKFIGCPRNASNEHKCFYQQLSKKDDHVTRATAFKCVDYLDEATIIDLHPLGKKWLEIVANQDIAWDIIESVTPIEGKSTAWDVTIPDAWTFMTADQMIVYDTMSVHVPISNNALTESRHMFPSRNLFNSSGELMSAPDQEGQVGLYLITKPGKKTNKNYVDVGTAVAAHKSGDIDLTDQIKVSGKSTTVGKLLVNSLLPKNARNLKLTMDKVTTKNLLTDVAKNNPALAPKLLDKLKDLGNTASYERGFTVRLRDLEFDRDKVVKAYDATDDEAEKIKKTEKNLDKRQQKLIQLFSTVDEQVTKDLKKDFASRPNSLHDMIVSGAKGSWGQVKQMSASPGMIGALGGKIIPYPIKHAYAAGLTSPEYWVAAHGARRGVVEKNLQTREPGEVNKNLLHSVIDNVISMDDCGTKKGIVLSPSDSECEDRYLVQPSGGFKRGTLVTKEVRQRLMKKGTKKIYVRSPMTCEASHGTCAKCFGLNEYGRDIPRGTNIGVISGQSITEPMTQMQMNTFHTGGLATGADAVDSFTKVRQLLEFPQRFKGEATLSKVSGKVDSIKPGEAGGYNVTIGGAKHFVPSDMNVSVKKGQGISRGDAVSNGIKNPNQLLELKGIPATREYVAEELYNTYRGMNKNIRRKHFEVLARSLTNNTRVMDIMNAGQYVPGDLVPYNLVVAQNRKNAKILPVEKAENLYPIEPIHGIGLQNQRLRAEDILSLKSKGIKEIEVAEAPIIHEPVLKGVKAIPLHKRDWLSQLSFTHLKDALLKGIPQGWESDTLGLSPIPGMIVGPDFMRSK